jgi:peptidyl-prolyl cis-trans isomerase C
MKRSMVALYFVLAGIVVLVFSCSSDKREELRVTQNVAARVGDTKVYEDEVEKRFERIPDSQKKEFDGLDGRAKLVDLLIDELVIVEEALNKKLHRVGDVEEKLESARRAVLVSEYYTREIVGKIEIEEDEIQAYYDEHPEEFTMRAVLRAQHILSEDSLKCVEWKKRIDNGEDFNKIAKNESEDEITATANGSLGYFNADGYVKSIGYSLTFGRAVEKLEVGEISDVISHEKGYSIVKLNEKKPANLLPLSEVRKRIVDKLRGGKTTNAYEAELARLRKKYEPENYYWNKVKKTKKTPQEIWERAQLESDPYQRIQYYREIVNQYPDDKYAPQALFMIGFVYAEELQDLVQARRTFDELLGKYPEADVVDDAKWMIENMDKPHPKFESIENMQKQMDQQDNSEDEEKE